MAYQYPMSPPYIENKKCLHQKIKEPKIFKKKSEFNLLYMFGSLCSFTAFSSLFPFSFFLFLFNTPNGFSFFVFMFSGTNLNFKERERERAKKEGYGKSILTSAHVTLPISTIFKLASVHVINLMELLFDSPNYFAK